MPKTLVRLACLSLIGMVNAAVAQTSYCWIAHVIQIGQDVELQFTAQSGAVARIQKAGEGVAPTDRMFQQVGNDMHRLYRNAPHPETAVAHVMLSHGEEAWVSNGLHSSCTIRLANQGSTFGVTMTSGVSLGGLTPQVTSRFVPAEQLPDTVQYEIRPQR